MNTEILIILLLLNVCHWLGDYTHLSRPWMLAAKKFGKPLLPIFIHAHVHAILMTFVLLFVTESKNAGWARLLQLSSHFVIDVLKGRLNKCFPSLQNPAAYPHWYIFGLDQFLHQVVIITMVYMVT